MRKKNCICTIARGWDVAATPVSFIINSKAREKCASDKLISRMENYLAIISYKPYVIAPDRGFANEMRQLAKSGKPVVLYDRSFPGILTCNAGINNRGRPAQKE